MCDIHERITLATIMQKDVFDHNFWTKALMTMILAPRSVFYVKEPDSAIFYLWPWPFKVMIFANHILGHISVTNGQTWPNLAQSSLGKGI